MSKLSIKTFSISLALVFLLTGCDQIVQQMYLGGYNKDIKKFTQAIEIAKNDIQRSEGYSHRARAYSEKARYSRFKKIIPLAKYYQMFDLAIYEHGKAIELNPRSAEAFFSRGNTYYNRAAFVGAPSDYDPSAFSKNKKYFDLALADFTKATEFDSGYYLAFDMKGLIEMSYKNYDQAISDFMQVMKIQPESGRSRLADAYCNRGGSYQIEKKYDEAILDYKKSIELYLPSSGCDCEAYNPLAWIYAERGEYAKSLEIVNKAKYAKVWIDPHLIEKLVKATGK